MNVRANIFSRAKGLQSDSDFVFCLQSYQGLIIDISPVY